MADNNLSKNIKIGIDVELNKRSVDEVTRQIAELSKNSIKLGSSAKALTAQDFSAKLFESFFNKGSKVTPKQIIDLLPTKELKAAAGQMIDVFRDVKEQLRDVGQQLKFDKGSARYVTAPLGKGSPTVTTKYGEGKSVTTSDFAALVREVKNLRNQDTYTSIGSSARGNIQIEGIRQLVLQEINQIVGGSANAGVKVSGLAKYISPSQASLTRIEESETGLTAIINNVGDDLEGLSDEVRAVISALNIDAGNLAKILGIRIAPTKIDPRAAFEESGNVQVEDLRSFYTGLKGGRINGQKFNPQDFADFSPGKDGSILVSPALLETAFQRVIEKIAPGTRQPGSDIVETKLAEALNKISSILDKINTDLFNTNINNPNSGRVWGLPSSALSPSGTWMDTKVYEGPTGANGQYQLPRSQGIVVGGFAESGAPPYSSDSMRKWTNFTNNPANAEAISSFKKRIQDDILGRAIEIALDAEAAQIEKLGGQDWSDEDIQHGMPYIMDAITNAVLDYEMKLGLNYGSIFNSLSSANDPKISSKLSALNLRGLLQKPYTDAVTGMHTGGIGFDPSNTIGEQIINRPEFLKQAKITRGIQDLMMQVMAELPKQIEQAVEPVVAQAAQTVAAESPFDVIFKKYEGLGLGAVIEKLKTVLAKSGGDTDKLLAGFDTEFLNGVLTPITELSIKVKDEFGKVVDLLDFFHVPAGLNATGKPIDPSAIDNMLSLQGVGPQSTKDIASRAAQMGFDASKLGSAGSAQGEAKANLELYQKKINAANAVLSMLNDLGITLAGSNVVSADFSKLAQSAENLNKVADQFDLEPTRVTNSLQNVVDIFKILEKLQKASAKDPQLEAILTKSLSGSGLKLSEIIGKILTQFPGALENVVAKDGKVTSIGGLPPHYAAADATGSIAIHAFLRELSSQYAAMSKNPGSWASASSYGHGGQLLPYSVETRGKYSSAFGNIQPELSFDSKARSSAADMATASQAVTDAQEKQAVSSSKAAMSVEEQTLQAVKATKAYREYAKAIEDAEKAIISINAKLAHGENVSREEKAALIKERISLAQTSADAKKEIDKIVREAFAGTVDSAYIKEINRAPYDTLARQQLTSGGSVVRNIAGGRVGAGASGAGRPPGGDGYITERGGEFLGPDPKATRDASEAIKRQLKDQADAVKETEKANKSLISTWISGRYALYDVGNAFQNVSQQAFRFTQQIFRLTDSYRNYETAFTAVDRSMQLLSDETQGMATMFVRLSETMPISFEQLTAIGTLGAQMGVTADGIKNFTEVVAKFSSVTGISAETTAQKFGRIAELANVDYSQFENLGSAIAYAGVNAVATESEILSLTEAIAAVSEQAGFAPEEIVGLSTAIASLGIAPEQARGVFTRVFADINRAVNTGGSALTNFAKVAGMSSEEFAATWADGNGGASLAFQNMLKGLKATGNMTKAFDDLNITETREVNTLTRLAENLDVVQSSMSDANMAFEDGAFLGDSFEKTVDNLDSKIQLFQNNFKSAMQSVSVGVAQTFGGFIDAGSKVLEFMKRMSENSSGFANAITMIFSAGGIIGAGAGTISVITKVLAQIYALRVAMINTSNDPNMVQGFGKNLAVFTNFGAALVEDHTKLTALNGKMGELTQVTYTASSAMAKLRGDTSAMFSELLDKNIYLSTGAGLAQAQGIDLKKQPEVERTRLARQEAQGVAQVVEARKRLLQTMEDELPWDNANKARSAATLEAARAEQIYIYATKEGIKAVDLDTQMALKNASAKDIEASAELKAARANIANAEANRAGAAAINTQTQAQSLASKGALGLGAKISGLVGPISIALTAISLIVMAIEAIKTAIDEANTVHLFEDQGGTAAIREAVYKDTQAWLENGKAIATVKSEVVNTRKEIPGYKTALQSAAKGQESLKTSTKDTTDEIKQQTLAIGQNAKELLAKALYENTELQDAFKQYPDIFNTMQEAGVNVSTLLEDMLNPNVTADELIAQLEEVKGYAYGISGAYDDALSVLEIAIRDAKVGIDDALSQSKLVTAVRKILGLVDETDTNINNLGATVRTVIDYANDLSGVFERIQQITLERLTARDGIVSGWRNIREAAKSAQEAIKAANDEITSLTADKAMLQYQYDVAKRYGDERRMAILGGKLAKVDNDIAKAQEGRADAEDQASTSLVGSSKAAIRNRATISGMIDTYQTYIASLARAGVKGKALETAVTKAKDSFISNAESVGFSKDQLSDYVGMFDDFLTAVKKTPRNVTIEFFANMSAAQNALNEFLAKANNSKATVQIDAKTGSGTDNLPTGSEGSGYTAQEIAKGVNKTSRISRDQSSAWGNLLNPSYALGIQQQANTDYQTALGQLRNLEARYPIAANRSQDVRDQIDTLTSQMESSLALNKTWSESGIKGQAKALFAKLPDWVQSAYNELAYQNNTIRKKLQSNVNTLTEQYNTLMGDLGTNPKLWTDKQVTAKNALWNKLSDAQDSLDAQDALTKPIEDALKSKGYTLSARKLFAGYATGGHVSGPGSGTSDSIPAMLSNGEYVIRANAVKAVGLGTLDKINNADRVKFASGGLVKGYSEGGQPALDSMERHVLDRYLTNPLSAYSAYSNKGAIEKLASKFTLSGDQMFRSATFNEAKRLSKFAVGQTIPQSLDRNNQIKSFVGPSDLQKVGALAKGLGGNTGANNDTYPSNTVIQYVVLDKNVKGVQSVNAIAPGMLDKIFGLTKFTPTPYFHDEGFVAAGQFSKILSKFKDKSGFTTYRIGISSTPFQKSNVGRMSPTPLLPGGNSGLPSYGWSGSSMHTRVGKANGGMISGPGGPREDLIPAMLSNGEYVMNAKATSAYGADFMNALNQQRVTFAQPQSMPQNSNNGPTMVYLSPEDRALLRAAVDRPVELYTENTKIAQSANAGNVILAQRGVR